MRNPAILQYPPHQNVCLLYTNLSSPVHKSGIIQVTSESMEPAHIISAMPRPANAMSATPRPANVMSAMPKPANVMTANPGPAHIMPVKLKFIHVY